MIKNFKLFSLICLIMRIIKVTIFIQRILLSIISLNHDSKPMRASNHCMDWLDIDRGNSDSSFPFTFPSSPSRHSHPSCSFLEPKSTRDFCLGKNSLIECRYDVVHYDVNFNTMSNFNHHWPCREKTRGVCVCDSLWLKIASDLQTTQCRDFHSSVTTPHVCSHTDCLALLGTGEVTYSTVWCI